MKVMEMPFLIGMLDGVDKTVWTEVFLDDVRTISPRLGFEKDHSMLVFRDGHHEIINLPYDTLKDQVRRKIRV